MMQRIMVLGLLPGTNYELSFGAILSLLLVGVIGYRFAVFYAVHHYSFSAKYRSYKVEQLLRKNHIA